jgi:beta-N-acetylhexosaminidase
VSGRPDGWLVCGVAGIELDADERRLLAEVRPAGVVLFARNVDDPAQLASLVRELRRLPSAPYVAIDLEGGRVNRLERLIGPLPASAAAARAGPRAVHALARAAASACAHFGIGVDFAPVVDVARRGGFLVGEARCFGASRLKVDRAAATFLAGLEAYGVAGCLKHYPGLGSGEVDSHRDLPELGEEVATDSEVFHGLAGPGRAVMVAHAVAPRLGEDALPATSGASGRWPRRSSPTTSRWAPSKRSERYPSGPRRRSPPGATRSSSATPSRCGRRWRSTSAPSRRAIPPWPRHCARGSGE